MKTDVIFSTRPLRPSDAYHCEQLSRKCFGDKFTSAADYVAYCSNTPAVMCVVAVDDQTTLPIGVIVFMVIKGAVMCTDCHVDPEYRRCGVGWNLVSCMERFAGGRDSLISYVDKVDGQEKIRQDFIESLEYKMERVIHHSPPDTGRTFIFARRDRDS